MGDDPLARAYYDDLVERLLFTAPGEVAAAVAAIPALDAQLLETLMAERADALATSGAQAELELLMHTREAVRGALAQRYAPSDVDDREAFLGAALACPDTLGAFMFLRRHDRLVDVGLYEELEDRLANGLAAGDPSGLHALCALGMLVDDPLIAGRTHLHWASALLRAGRLAKAAVRVARAAEVAKREDDAPLQLWSAGAEAMIAEARGDREAAVQGLAAVLELAERDGDPTTASAVRMKLADILHDLGHNAEALALLDTVLAQGGDPRREARVRRLRALVLDDLGRYEEGEAEYRQAASTAAAAGDTEAEFVALTDIAWSALKRGDPDTAIRRLDRLVRLAERETNLARVAAAHNNLGTAYLDAGQPADARRHFSRAFEIRMSMDDNDIGLAMSFIGLGDAARDLGEADIARTSYVLALMPAVASGDEETLTRVTSHLADVDSDDETLAVLERRLRQSPSDALASAVANQHVRRNDLAQAERVLRTAIAREAAIDPRSLAALRLREQLGALLARQAGRRDDAYGLLRSVVDDVLDRVATSRLDERRSEIVSDWIHAFDDLVGLLVADGSSEAAAEAFTVHEAAKGRSFAAELAGSALRAPPAVPVELRDRERRLSALERELQRADGDEDGGRLARRLARLDELRDALERCWTAIAPYAPEYVALRRGEPATAHELRAALAAAASVPVAFVSFFCGPKQTTVFVVRSDDSQLRTLQASVGRDDIAAAVAAMRRAFNGAPDAFPPLPPIRRDRPHARPLPELDVLGERVLGDVPSAVEGCELLCLAPHGPLHGLPLHALALGRGRGVLADEHAVVYASSATTLAHSLARTQRSPQHIAVAGVASRSDAHRDRFEHDDELFDGLRNVVTAPGTAATKAAIAGLLTRDDVVHVTCHGYFDPRSPMSSGLLLSDGKVRPPRDREALSVAKRRRFVLSAREILATSTQACLVMLRACSTGAHTERRRGDELEGLGRALIHAGAGAVAVNLWNVDQRSSRALVAGFYRHWLDPVAPQPAWRALWLAQQALRATVDAPHLRHPYHWAPLVLTGDWR